MPKNRKKHVIEMESREGRVPCVRIKIGFRRSGSNGIEDYGRTKKINPSNLKAAPAVEMGFIGEIRPF